MKLVRKDNHEIETIGTLEEIRGCASISEPHHDKNGRTTFDYEGSTDVWWDTQETVMVGNEVTFVDSSGNTVLESKIELIEELL